MRLFKTLTILLLCSAGPHAVRADRIESCGNGPILFSASARDMALPRPYLRQIADDGWTIERRIVKESYAKEKDEALAMRARIDEARAANCPRIALIGESLGAWASLIANASFETPIDGESIQAVIAIDASASQAPAQRDGWHDYKFVNLLKAQDPAHLAIFLYDVPHDDAADRKAEISRSLTNRNRDAQIFVETASYESDADPHGEAFAKNYSATLRALLDGPPPLGLAAAPSAR